MHPTGFPSVWPRSAIDTTVFHYSGADADEQADHANCAARVRGIQGYHMDTQGWLDHRLLVPGLRPRLRLRRSRLRRPHPTGPANGHSLAVCFLGNDSAGRADVTPAAQQAHLEIARAINERYARVVRYAGHRDFMATACPGDELYRYIRSAEFARASAPRDTLERAALAPALAALEAGRGRGAAPKRGAAEDPRGRLGCRRCDQRRRVRAPLSRWAPTACSHRERMVESAAARRRIAAMRSPCDGSRKVTGAELVKR